MAIERLDGSHPPWDAYVAHLEAAKQAQWVLDAEDHPTADVLFLGAVEDGRVVGDLALKEQVVTLPATEWSGGVDRPLLDPEGIPVRETLVMTFFVDEVWRRRGIGRALQQAAVALTREQGCTRMRSWSSLDKPGNYTLELSLGFAMQPAVHDADSGYQVSGVYFVQRVDTPS